MSRVIDVTGSVNAKKPNSFIDEYAALLRSFEDVGSRVTLWNTLRVNSGRALKLLNATELIGNAQNRFGMVNACLRLILLIQRVSEWRVPVKPEEWAVIFPLQTAAALAIFRQGEPAPYVIVRDGAAPGCVGVVFTVPTRNGSTHEYRMDLPKAVVPNPTSDTS